MMHAYFKAKGRLIRVDVPTSDPGIAQVETYLAAAAEKVQPESPVMVVIHGGRAAR